MTEKFLKAKHWQLFLLTFGIPMLFQIVLMITMFANIGNGNNPDVSLLFDYFMFFPNNYDSHCGNTIWLVLVCGHWTTE